MRKGRTNNKTRNLVETLGLEPEFCMGNAAETMEQIINLWKTIICEYIAVLVSHFQISQTVLVLITFSQILESHVRSCTQH